MKKLNESDFANLEPRAQPYEVRAEVDLALRIFPNGSKIWVYIYFDKKVVQRETLGIYPAMATEQAYLALEEARHTLSRKDEATPQNDHSANKSWTKRHAGGLSAVAASLLAAVLLVTYMPFDKNMLTAKIEGLTTSATESVAKVIEIQTTTVQKLIKTSEEPAITTPPADNTTPIARIETEAPITTPSTMVEAIESDVTLHSNGLVKRAQFTSGIRDREPIDQIDQPLATLDETDNTQQLYFFTEVAKLEGRTIYHRWQLDGKVMAEIPFEVKSNWRWRVFSSKKILPSMQGEWQVSVVDDLGNILHSAQFTIQTMGNIVNDSVGETEMNTVALLQQ